MTCLQVRGNALNLGLGTPVAEVLHDRQTGVGGFASLIFNVNPANQLRLVTSVRRDTYRIPNGPDDQAAGIDDNERESNAFVNLSWVRTFSSGKFLTVSPNNGICQSALINAVRHGTRISSVRTT